jgi:hypothetical protein
VKREYWAALAVLLLIPVVFMGGMTCAVMIEPEWALKTAHYGRNYRLLEWLKVLLIWGSFGSAGLLWLAMFLLLLKGKGRSFGWAALALLGPLGLAGMAVLQDAGPPADADAYRRWRAGHGFLRRAVSEAVFFVAAWSASYELVVLKRDVQILLESRATGVPVARIVAIQAASSGMWAFSEGLEQLFLIALMYLAWPLCVNAASRLYAARSKRPPLRP